MEATRLGEMEGRFAELIWQNAPVGSGRLVQLCAEELGWKKSTTYTMLKRLCSRGLFANEGGVVRACVSPEEFAAMQSEQFVAERFGGSLPQFLAAFTRRHRLSEAEIAALQRMIDAAGEEGAGGESAAKSADSLSPAGPKEG